MYANNTTNDVFVSITLLLVHLKGLWINSPSIRELVTYLSPGQCYVSIYIKE